MDTPSATDSTESLQLCNFSSMNTQFTKGESSTSQFSNSPNQWNYDVFLSFRGKDTRKGFTGHLYFRLDQVGVKTFIDDEELRKGDVISRELEKAIEESRISIVVFSQNYASSSWCLDELVKIIECKEKLKQMVLPIFYHVDPCQVRWQKGVFGEALANHKKRFEAERIGKWTAALTEAANLSGWDLLNVADGHESKFIEGIIQQVLQEVNQTPLDVAYHPVGLDTRINDIESLLNKCQNEVRMVGIYGVGGIGKTTLAKAIYNKKFLDFDGRCFLSDVRSKGKTSDRLVKLQQKLLRQLLMNKDLKVNNVDEGISLIKARLGSKKVLIVLDDLDHVRQLQCLARDRSWFGRGSLIIITTRDEHLLCVLVKNERYKAKLLNDNDAVQLFSGHAFNRVFPPQEYVELAQDIVCYADGLALALATLGSHLQGRSVGQWRNDVKKLRAIPHRAIQEILKISYDGLDVDTQRVFLDISCAFHGFLPSEVIGECVFYSESEIATLVQRQLLTKEENYRLVMHDLVRDMGREIVRLESPLYPGRRSRLFIPQEVSDVLQGNKGSEMVEVLVVDPVEFRDMSLSTEAFKKMKNLRVLIIDKILIRGDFELLSKELRWLSWQKCPLKCIPSNFPAEQLVVLNMMRSNIEEFGLNLQCCKSLKKLDLSFCKYLRRIGDIKGSPSLETLSLDCCTSLTKIHPSMGKLERLSRLYLPSCGRLKGLPNTICHLKFLQWLNMNDCLSIETLPNELGDLQSLRALWARNTGIKQLPRSVENLCVTQLLVGGPKLKDKMHFSPRRVLHGIRTLSTSLKKICLTYCGLSEADIPTCIGSLSLWNLDLSGNNFHYLPFDFSKMQRLTILGMNDCENLQMLPSLSNLENLEICSLANCKRLVKITGVDNLSSINRINIVGCSSLQNPFNEGFFSALAAEFPFREKRFQESSICLQCSDIPEWCNNKVRGSSLCFTMPTHMEGRQFLGIMVWRDRVRFFMRSNHFGLPDLSFSIAEKESSTIMRLDRHLLRHGEISWVLHKAYLQTPFDGKIKGGEKVEISEYWDHLTTESDKENRAESDKENGVKIEIRSLYLDQHGDPLSVLVDQMEPSLDINENVTISVEENHELSVENYLERHSTTGLLCGIWSKISSLSIFCCFNP